jgi:hypothetical protein
VELQLVRRCRSTFASPFDSVALPRPGECTDYWTDAYRLPACPLMMIPLRALLAQSVSAIDDGSRNAAEVDVSGGSIIVPQTGSRGACTGFLFLHLGYLQIWPSRR